MKRKPLTATFIALLCMMLFSCQKEDARLVSPTPTTNDPTANVLGGYSIPLGGNAYVTKPVSAGTEEITVSGLTKWSSNDAVTSTFFRVSQSGQLNLSIRASVPIGTDKSTIHVIANGVTFTVEITGFTYKKYNLGTIDVNDAGYVKVDLVGVNKGSNPYFANVSDIIVDGSATASGVMYVSDPATFSAARKGPALQLQYIVPIDLNAEWFYNELTVPINSDKIGTYYISNGFNGGEFGMIVNSETDKQIVFTVNDNLNNKVSVIRTGGNVSNTTLAKGGKSSLVYNWKAGTTYKFLTQGKPDGSGNTIFSSWFYATELGEWKFIASWKRPGISSYLKKISSSLAGTIEENGYIIRKARYYNQWIKDDNGNWSEVTSAAFNGDATASNLLRYDFVGSVDNSAFYLKTNGFFPENVELKTSLTRAGTISTPDIDFNSLP